MLQHDRMSVRIRAIPMETTLRRYLLFTFYDYYPCGGWGDFDGSFNSVEEAKEFAKSKNHHIDNIEIIDIVTGEEV